MSDDILDTAGRTGRVLLEFTEQARDADRAGASRRSFFTRSAALASATALGAAGARLLQPIAAHAATTGAITDTSLEIINVAATAESLGITFYYYALASSQLPSVNSKANRNYFQAAVTQEFEHLKILESLGATPLATDFYFPVDMFTDETVFFATASLLEDFFISAYIAAAREFSGAVSSGITTANPTAIGLAVQIAGIECEHRALLRVAASQNPPNNVIIEQALVASVADAAAALGPFLSAGSGTIGPVPQPSRAAVEAIAKPYGIKSFPAYTID